jgi:drug/metabolite transporter (DMT)-like permease
VKAVSDGVPRGVLGASRACQSALFWIWLALPLCTVLYHFAAKETGICWRNADFGPALRCMQHSNWFRIMVISDIGGFIAWMYVLRDMKLSAAFPISAISYVIVMAISWLFFGEAVSSAQIGGSLMIIAGVLLIGVTSERR